MLRTLVSNYPLMFSNEELLTLLRDRVPHPASVRELIQILRIPREERTSFKRLLRKLAESGDLVSIRGNRFGLPERMDVVVGRLTTNPGGFGFVVPVHAEGERQDV